MLSFHQRNAKCYLLLAHHTLNMPLNKSQQVQNVATLHNILLFEPENVLRGCTLLVSMAAVA